MSHGILGYYEELARFARRVSALSAGVGALSFALLILIARTPAFHEALRDATHFGYEGADQYVRRIELLQTEGRAARLHDVGNVTPVLTLRGGQKPGPTSKDPHAAPSTRLPIPGPGDAAATMIQRAVSRRSDVPVMRSEDLVIERLVKPSYPEMLLERNIEGKVTIQALVDTLGQVVDVQVMTSTGELLFEEAAIRAVHQWRFRPFRRGGNRAEVYAVCRFNFRIEN